MLVSEETPLIMCEGHPHIEAKWELKVGRSWQPHCDFCMKEATDCGLGATIRRLDYERDKVQGQA